MSSPDEEEEESLTELEEVKQKKSTRRNEFIDDEAELSGDDEVSEDEDEPSDDDGIDPELVDPDAPELDSDQEEEVRGMYVKQLVSEDRRAVLLLKEQLEDKNVALGHRRRKKFKWQTAEMMENSLRRHYDPDDDDSQDDDDDPLDDLDFEEVAPRLKRPAAESFLLGPTRAMALNDSGPSRPSRHPDILGAAAHPGMSDDSNSNTINLRPMGGQAKASKPMDINRFVFRDREIVQALSKETVIVTREEKDKAIERELKRVLQSKSIFDQLYT